MGLFGSMHPTYRNRKIRGIQNNGVDVILFRTADGQEYLGRIELELIEQRRIKAYVVKSRCFGVHDEFGFNYGYVKPNEVIRKVLNFRVGDIVKYKYHDSIFQGRIIKTNKQWESGIIKSYVISGQFKYGNKALISAEDVIGKIRSYPRKDKQ